MSRRWRQDPAKLTRRQALAAAASGPLTAGRKGLTLSLSTRIVEAPGSKEKTILGFEEFLSLARRSGYGAICMRASQAGIHTPRERVVEMRRALDRAGLKVSMVTGDIAVVANNDQGPQGLRRIGPYLDLAGAFGAALIRVCMKKPEDIGFAQRAADEARERKIRLAHQSHHASLFETVEGSVETLRRIGRPNFGIIYEPANWMAAGEDYGPRTIGRIRPWLMNVYLQNHRLNPAGKSRLETWSRGPVAVDPIGLWEKGGVDFDRVFDGLRSAGYSGAITVHQAFAEIMGPEEAARKSYEYLQARLLLRPGPK